MVEIVSSTNLIKNYVDKLQNDSASKYAVNYHNNLERTPRVDSFALNSDNTKKKTLLYVLSGLAVVVGSFCLYHKFRPRTMESITNTFEKLRNDLPNAQKQLRTMSLRTDIDEKETLSILNRYEEIEKAGLSQSKENYFRSVFEHAIEVFGFKNTKPKLVFTDLSKKECQGLWTATENTVYVDLNKCSKESGFGIIHHELRHAKQEQLLEMYSSKCRIYEILKNDFNKDNKGFKTLDEYIESAWTKEFQNKFLENRKPLFRRDFPFLKDFDFDKIISNNGIKEWVKSAKTSDHRTLEFDARVAEDLSYKLAGYNIPYIRRLAEKLDLIYM